MAGGANQVLSERWTLLTSFRDETAALQAALKDPGFRDAMDKLGAIIVPPAKQTPDGLRTFLKAEIDKWTPIIRKTGVYAD